MHNVLNNFRIGILGFLNDVLPNCDIQWWDNCVLAKLTFSQLSDIEVKNINSLSEIDLAGLLRIFDLNWHLINLSNELPTEVKNWVKDAQSIRSRWAHLLTDEMKPDDVFRDVDTIWRLLTAINADKATVEQSLITRNAARVDVDMAHSVATAMTISNSPKNTIAKGDIVQLKSRPDRMGAVVDVLEGQETRYQVFHDGSIATYYASQIEKSNPVILPNNVDADYLHASLTSLQLRHPSTNHLYSLAASRINFVPYQFRPVIKLIQNDRPRMLIADEVGVGKTIEAGLILKELQARRDIRSVLVICPKPLVAERKWQEEMKRFDEQFVHLDGSTLRYCIEETHLDGVWPQQYSRSILPYSLFDETFLCGGRQGKKIQYGLLDLDPPPHFDLVIVDEAHHIRNTETWAHRVVRHFCDNADAVVLLSATPIQMGDKDLFNLLHLLRPDVLHNRQVFNQMSEPNPFLNVAVEFTRAANTGWRENVLGALDGALATVWGKGVLRADPRVQKLYDQLVDGDIDTESRLTMVRQLEELHTFSALINRTRRRDIGNFTSRNPETISIEFTLEQAELHNDLLDIIARILAHKHGNENLNFMMSTVRRQLSSCVFGLAPYLEALLNRHLDQFEVPEVESSEMSDEVAAILADFRNDVDAIINKARSLAGEDPKFDAFLKVIKDKQKLNNNKLLVFSTFRHTLAYLNARLAGETVRVGLIHGDVSDSDRRELRNRFSLPKENSEALDALLSSEVGCEGLDFQFCDGLINYDLPWNPMRVEQRIGRIDRYGQKSATVVIYNFITPGTVDAEVYERCLLRIGVFRQALGGSEEILGRLTREIRDIAENFTLSTAQQNERLQQLSDNEIRVIQEQNRLEEEQAKLFGLTLPKSDEDMVTQASSFWLTPSKLANLVELYFKQLGISKEKCLLTLKPTASLQLGQEMRNKLLSDFKALKLSGSVANTWERWLKGSDSHLKLTFDSATADDLRDIVFITPTHPLARQAAQMIERTTALICNLTLASKDLPSGRYPYAIYRWRIQGLKEDFTFKPICANPEIVPHLLQLLETAQSHETSENITEDEKHTLEDTHYQLWNSARAEHIEELSEIAQLRMNSLKTTHSAQVSLLAEQRANANHINIDRMRDSQIKSAENDYQRRKEALTKAAQQSDIFFDSVVFGVIFVERSYE